MIKFKFVGFIISFLAAILVITNGNGSLLQNAFGDADSIEDSVDEIVESAEEESDDVRDEGEDISEEAREDADIDSDVKDRDEDEDEDKEEDTDNGDDSSDETSLMKFASDLGEDGEDGRAGPTGIGKDESDVPSGLGEGSGMQIFVSPRERINEILDQHLDNIEEQANIQEDIAFHPASTPGGVGASPGNVPTIPRLGLTFDEDFNNLSTGHGNEGNIFFFPLYLEDLLHR